MKGEVGCMEGGLWSMEDRVWRLWMEHGAWMRVWNLEDQVWYMENGVWIMVDRV